MGTTTTHFLGYGCSYPVAPPPVQRPTAHPSVHPSVHHRQLQPSLDKRKRKKEKKKEKSNPFFASACRLFTLAFSLWQQQQQQPGHRHLDSRASPSSLALDDKQLIYILPRLLLAFLSSRSQPVHPLLILARSTRLETPFPSISVFPSLSLLRLLPPC